MNSVQQIIIFYKKIFSNDKKPPRGDETAFLSTRFTRNL